MEKKHKSSHNTAQCQGTNKIPLGIQGYEKSTYIANISVQLAYIDQCKYAHKLRLNRVYLLQLVL